MFAADVLANFVACFCVLRGGLWLRRFAGEYEQLMREIRALSNDDEVLFK
jgi:hypothetical protein